MDWKQIVGPLVSTSRRKVVTSSIIYGVALTVRLTSSAGETSGHAAQAAPGSSPSLSIMISDGPSTFRERALKAAQPIVFYRGTPRAQTCRAGCDRPMQLASVPDCIDP